MCNAYTKIKAGARSQKSTLKFLSKSGLLASPDKKPKGQEQMFRVTPSSVQISGFGAHALIQTTATVRGADPFREY